MMFVLVIGSGTLTATLAQPLSDDPLVVDISTLPDEIETNLSTFLIAGTVSLPAMVSLNSQNVPVDEGGNFVAPVPLAAGANMVEVIITLPENDVRVLTKTVTYNAELSTADKRLIYVDSVSPSLPGTIVIDADALRPLGVILNRHVRAILPDGTQLFMHDGSVFSTESHQAIDQLPVSQDIPHDAVVVSRQGDRLYVADEVIDLTLPEPEVDMLPMNIQTGQPFCGPNPGGPDVTLDDATLYCCLDDRAATSAPATVKAVNTATFIPKTICLEKARRWQSDITICGDILVRVTYAGQSTFTVDFYDVTLLSESESDTTCQGGPIQPLGSVRLPGDFGGEAVCSTDNSKVIGGASGNPRFRNGGVAAISLIPDMEMMPFQLLDRVSVHLADNLAISEQDEIFSSSGNRSGIDTFTLQTDGQLVRTASYVLGINRSISRSGCPGNNEIRRIVYKRSASLE